MLSSPLLVLQNFVPSQVIPGQTPPLVDFILVEQVIPVEILLVASILVEILLVNCYVHSVNAIISFCLLEQRHSYTISPDLIYPSNLSVQVVGGCNTMPRLRNWHPPPQTFPQHLKRSPDKELFSLLEVFKGDEALVTDARHHMPFSSTTMTKDQMKMKMRHLKAKIALQRNHAQPPPTTTTTNSNVHDGDEAFSFSPPFPMPDETQAQAEASASATSISTSTSASDLNQAR
jgi:hypothetical protein